MKFSLSVITVFLMFLSCKNSSNSNETKIPSTITKVKVYESINDEEEFLLMERYYEHGKIIREEQYGIPGTNFHSSKLFNYNKLNLLVKEINIQMNNGTKTVTKSLYIHDSKGRPIKELIVHGKDTTIATLYYNKKSLLIEKEMQNNPILGTVIFKYEYDKNDSLSSQSHSINGSIYLDKYIRNGNKVIHETYAFGQLTEQTEIHYKNGMVVYSLQQSKEQIGTQNFTRKFRANYVGKNIVRSESEEHYSNSYPNGEKIVYRYEYY